jgi:hypothetical protein
MQQRYHASVTITLHLQHQTGEPPPPIASLLDPLLVHPLISGHTIWQSPTWEERMPPWSTLETSPCEAGDIVIHACEMDRVTRIVLSQCILDGPSSPLRLIPLPTAGDEHVERAALIYLRRRYRLSFHLGIYPCPEWLRQYAQNCSHREEAHL